MILTILAVSIGHRVSLALKLSRYHRDKLKALYLAKAGVNRAIVELEKDQNEYDSLDETWSRGHDTTGKSLFENVELREGSGETFTVKYLYDKEKDTYLCMADEERKININTGSNNLLVALLMECSDSKFDVTQAEELAGDIRIWRGENVGGINPDAEYYENFKKAPFINIEELVIVLEHFFQNKDGQNYQNEAQEVYKNIKDLITVYPLSATAQINVNTASWAVLTILTNSVANSDEKNSVAGFVNTIIELRDNQPNKAFENVVDITVGGAGSDYQNLLNKLKPSLTVQSGNFLIAVTGNVSTIKSKIRAVYNRNNKKILYWHEG